MFWLRNKKIIFLVHTLNSLRRPVYGLKTLLGSLLFQLKMVIVSSIGFGSIGIPNHCYSEVCNIKGLHYIIFNVYCFLKTFIVVFIKRSNEYPQQMFL